MDNSILLQSNTHTYLSVIEALAELKQKGLDNIHAYSFLYKIIKGGNGLSPMTIYHKPTNCLPFDEYEEAHELEAVQLLEDLRDAAYRNIEITSEIDYLDRQEFNKRACIEANGFNGDVRISTAAKVAIIAMLAREGIEVDGNFSKAADLLTWISKEAGVPFSFERGTIRNWYNSVKHLMADRAA